jgi:hypothetical protein
MRAGSALKALGQLSVAFFVLAIAQIALAANDGAALKLRKQAIYTDYLATDFAAAEKALNKALSLCAKPTDCEPSTRARLHCDLGAVLAADSKKDEATAQFQAALKDDPSVTIDKDVTSQEAEQAFAAAKGGGAAPAAPDAGGEAPATGKPPAGKPPAAESGEAKPPPVEGDMKHEPVVESPTSTPIPLYVEVDGATKVYARYKPIGGDWKTVQFKKMGEGWGGQIPCGDIGDSPGDIKYFIQATSGEGDVIASYGRQKDPAVAKLVAQLTGEAPHFPDQEPPGKCAASSSDCPPDFPGCHAKEEKVSCQSNEDCETPGQTCVEGFCSSPEEAAAGEVPPKMNWISVSVQQDFLLLPGKSDVCLGGQGYACFDTSNNYYQGVPEAGIDDTVSGGLGLATTRFLIGYDRLFGDNFMLGVRLGYAIGGGPQRNPTNGPSGAAFLPVHAEGRFAYFIGKNPFRRKGFRFYAAVSGGIAEVDSSLQTWAYPQGATNTTPENQYNAWMKTGTGFGAVSLGSMFAITPAMGPFLEIKGMELFPTMGTALGAQLGYSIGF